MFGNLLNKSPMDMMMFAFTPKSILDLSKLKSKSMCYEHRRDETHIILQRAKIADLSRMQTVGGDYIELSV